MKEMLSLECAICGKESKLEVGEVLVGACVRQTCEKCKTRTIHYILDRQPVSEVVDREGEE